MYLSSTPFRAAILDELRHQCGQLVSPARLSGALTGWATVDSYLPAHGFALGTLHEWIGVCSAGNEISSTRTHWTVGVSMLAHVARAALQLPRNVEPCVAWIGRSAWCSPQTMAKRERMRGGDLLTSSLFVDARSQQERLWTTDLALRCGVCAVVIADGSGFDLSDTRRLQLAAEAGARLGGGLCLLARPPWEAHELSAAATRWLVRRAVSPNSRRRWSVELLRCKGMQPSSLDALRRPWVVERDDATGALCVVTDVRDGLGEKAAGAGGPAATVSAAPPRAAARTG